MGRYRRKPMDVDAWQFVPDTELPDWMIAAAAKGLDAGGVELGRFIPDGKGQMAPCINVSTGTGIAPAVHGLWILRRVEDGILEVWMPEMFENVYEAA